MQPEWCWVLAPSESVVLYFFLGRWGVGERMGEQRSHGESPLGTYFFYGGLTVVEVHDLRKVAKRRTSEVQEVIHCFTGYGHTLPPPPLPPLDGSFQSAHL